MDEGCKGKAVVRCKIGFQRGRINRGVVVGGMENGGPAVERNKVRIPPSVDPVVEDKNPVSGLCHAGKGRLNAEDPLPGENEGLVIFCVEEALQVMADPLGKGIEVRIQIRVDTGEGERLPHVLRDLGGPRRHELIGHLQKPGGRANGCTAAWEATACSIAASAVLHFIIHRYPSFLPSAFAFLM